MNDASSDRDPIEVLAEEFMERKRRGENPTLREYEEKYPELAADIRDLFPALVVIEDYKPVSETGNGSLDEGLKDSGGKRLRELGDYRILREVGRGGMGVVYEAEQVSLGRRVALKVLPQQSLLNAKQRYRFEREARSAARLHHTNIVPIFGVGEQDGWHYYVMQFIQGLGLDEVLEELKRLRAGTAAGANPTQPGELRVSRKDVSATMVAHSLMTGSFAHAAAQSDAEPIVPRPQGSATAAGTLAATVAHSAKPVAVAAGDATAGPPTGVRCDPTIQLEPSNGRPNVAKDHARSTASSRLSDTFSLSDSFSGSSVSFLGGSESGERGRPKKSYWHSLSNIGMQVASALHYAHDQGILHRDIKPSNLLLDTRGTVWVTDFGLAKADDQQNLTHTGDILGTLRYMPPEAFEGQSDARSDVYSLGLTLYELIALQPAFDESERNKLIKQVTTGEPARLSRVRPDAPRDLVTIVHKAVDREPSRRYQTASELADDLDRFIHDEPIRARRLSHLERVVRWARHNRAIAGLSAAIAVILVVASVASGIAAIRMNLLADSRQSALDAVVIESNAKQVALGAAEMAKEQAQQLATDNRRSLVRFNAEHGAEFLERGDSFGSLPWFAEALALDEDIEQTKLHRIRLATTLRHAPKLVNCWTTRPGAGHVSFSPEGTYLAVTNTRLSNWVQNRESTWRSSPVYVWDVATGAATPPLAHDRAVFTTAFSPKGDRLATVGLDEMARIWDPKTGQMVQSLKVQQPSMLFVAFSPDGQRLLTGGSTYSFAAEDRRVRIWDAQTGLRAIDLVHPYPVLAAAFSPDGRRVAAAAGALVYVWDAANGAPIGQPLRGIGKVVEVTFAADGQSVVAFELDGSIRHWDIHSGQSLPTPRANDVSFRALSPDRRRAAAVLHQSNAFQVWDLQTGQPSTRPLEHELEITEIAFSDDGKLVVSAGRDRAARVWVAESGRLLAVLRHSSGVISAAFHPSGRLVATLDADGQVRVWDLAGMEPATPNVQHDAYVHHADFSPDGRYLATASADGTARLWNSLTGQPHGSPLRHDRPVVHLAFSHDGKHLVTSSDDSTARVWDVETAKPRLARPLPHNGPVNFAEFSPDGATIVTASDDGSVRLWNATTGDRIGEAMNHRARVVEARFSPDGNWIVTAGSDKKARIWDARTGKARTEEIWHAASVSTAMFSADSRVVLTAATGTSLAAQQARLWDAATGRPMGPPLPHADAILDATITNDPANDGEWLVATASSDSTARVWNGRTGAPITAPLRHESHVVSVKFSPDSRQLATASRDGKVRVFDVRTGILVTPPLPHGNLLTRVAFHPSGKLLAAASVDGRVQLWNVSSDDRPVEAWRAMAGVVSGQRLDVRGAALPAITADVQRAWQELPESFRDESRASESQVAAWGESLLIDARRSARRQQARAAAEEAAVQFEAGEWDASIAAYRKAVELSRADYDFPLLHSLGRILDVPLAIGDDPQELLKKLGDDEPRFVTLWLDEEQVQQRPASAGLNASRQLALGVGVANEPSGGGVRVTGFRSFGRAETAGLQVSDLITHVDGVAVSDVSALRRALSAKRLGQNVAIRVNRGAIVVSTQVPVLAEFLDTNHRFLNTAAANSVEQTSPTEGSGLRPLFGATSSRGRGTLGSIRDGKRTQILNGVPRENVLAQFELLPDGYMPIWMHADGVGPDQRWTVIWGEDEGKRAWRQHDRLNMNELRERLDHYTAEGWRPTVLCGYGTALGDTRYWAVWIKDATPHRVALHQTEAELRSELAALPKNWRPERIYAYRESGQRRFNTIFVEDAVITRWSAHLNVPDWAAQMHHDKLSRERYLLVAESIDTTTTSNAAAFVEDSERGKALAEAGALEVAAEAFAKASEAATDEAEYPLRLAQVRVRQARWDEAAAALREGFRRLAVAHKKANANLTGDAQSTSAPKTWERFAWSVTGPYPSDDDGTTIVGGEPRPDTPPKATEPVGWTTATSQASDNLNLDARFADQPGVYYARQHVYSEREERVAVQVGRDSKLRVWLNDSLVHEGAGSTPGIAPLVNVALRPGWNTLVARLNVPRKHQLLARWYVEPAALARTYESHERYEDALAEWSKEIIERPKDHIALVSRGRVAAKLKRYGEAVADFEKALELRPNDQALRYELTLVRADWSASLVTEPATAKQSEQLADQAVAELRRTLELGMAGLNYIQVPVADEPRLTALTKRRDVQDLLARAVDPGDLADIIYHRFGEMGGGFWASNQSLQSILDVNKQMTEQDSRPYYISADQQADGATFAACWQSDGKSFRTNLHATWEEIERARSELPDGFLPTSLDAYRYGKELRWMVVWTREESPPAWRIETDLSRDALESRLNEFKAQRFHPALINSYSDLQNRLRFAVVWVQDQAECDVHLKLTADEVRKKLDALATGWRPLWLEGYLEDSQRYVAAIFVNDGKSPEWKVATGQPSTAILAQIREIRFDRFWAAQQSLTVDPANTPAIQRRADLLTQFGRNDDAIAELSRGIALAPDQVELYRARAKLYATSGRSVEADADYAAALKLKPEDEDLRVERGRVAAFRHTRIVIPSGSEWKWIHPTDGVDPSAKESAFRTTFFRADYDDRHWKSGRDVAGGFGYGEAVGVNIGVPALGQRLTAYFRHRFVTKEPLENVTLSCQRDDGLIVYLDGVEVARENMRSGLDTYEARAETNIEDAVESRIVVLPIVKHLPPGEHTLAISLHSFSSRSSDLRIANIVVRGSPLGAKPQDVRDPQLLADRAAYFYRENNVVRAEADYAAALALAPDAADIALRRGRFLAAQNRWKDAIADFDVVIRQRADDAQLLVERAMFHARLGARAAALADLTQATKLRPNDVSFRRQQGQLYALLDGNVIVPATSRWRWLHPTDGIDPATEVPDFHSTFFRLDFDDAAWREDRDSPGEKGGFGYGHETAVDIGTPASGRRLSAYFRHKFRTDATYDSLILSLRRDDGVIVYLDGVEVARENMRAPAAEGYRLLAVDASLNQPRQRSIAIPRELPAGDHVLAISLHNINPTSSDLVLGSVALLGSRREVAETSLDDLEALAARADTFAQSGHIDRALGDWTRMIELAPDDMQPVVKRADANYAAGRWEQALADYKRLAERFEPRNLDHYYQSQRCLNRLRRFEESRAVINEAIKIATTPAQRSEYLALRGYTWVLEGQWDRAADDYVAALATAPNELHVNHLRDATTTFAAAGRMNECLKVRDQLLERLTQGRTKIVQEDIRELLVLPLTPEQMADVERLSEEFLTSFRGVWAGVYYRAGRFQEALDRIEESNAYFIEHRFVRALVLMRLGRIEQSRAALAEANAQVEEELAATAPGELPHLAHDWQRIIAWRREATEAIVDRPLAELDRALKMEPTNSKLRAERGRLALAVGKQEEALVDLNEAIATKADDPWAYAGRGDLYAQHNRWEEAAADYLMALRLSPADADLVSRLDSITNRAWLYPIAADAERDPVEWRRTLTRPDANWAALDYDDQAWETAPGPFGTNTRASDRGRTAWTTADIWLRREFDIAELPQELLAIRTKFDDGIDVYINGVRAAQSTGFGNYRMLTCLGPAAAAVRTGRNVLAVHCRNTDGRGFVDVGLYTNPGPRKLVVLLDELVAKQPQAVALLAKRCELLVQLERWDLAAADAAAVRALEPEPEPGDYWNREVPSRTARLVGSNAELFHRVHGQRTDDYFVLVARVKHLAAAGRWKELAPILAAALQVDSNDNMAQSTYARVLAYLGDVDAYRRLRDGLMERYGKSDDALGVYTASQACVLLDDSEFEGKAALAIAERSMELSRGESKSERAGRQPTRNLVLALANMRLGKTKEADAAVQLALDESLDQRYEYRRATCLTVRALIRQQENKVAEARELLAEADGIVRAGRSASATGQVGDDWREWLRYEVLRVQAVRAINDSQR